MVDCLKQIPLTKILNNVRVLQSSSNKTQPELVTEVANEIKNSKEIGDITLREIYYGLKNFYFFKWPLHHINIDPQLLSMAVS